MSNQTRVEKQVAIEGSEKFVIAPRMTVVPKFLGKSQQKMPIFITKNNKITLIEGQKASKLFLKSVQPTKNAYKNQLAFREDIIYRSTEGDFLRGNPQQNVVIMNRLDLTNNSCRTIAQFINQSDKSVVYEKTSDAVTELIGQDSFDTVLSALVSVINQELKVKGIMGLLVEDKPESLPKEKQKTFAEKCCQTDVNCMELIYRIKQKKRIKRTQLIPYVVKDSPMEKKRVVIHPDNAKITDNTEEMETMEKCSENREKDLPDIRSFNEDSNASTSTVGNISTLSGITTNFKFNNLLDNPTEIFKQIDQCTATGDNKIKPVQTQESLQQSQQSLQNSRLNNSDSTKLSLTQQTIVENATKVQQLSPQRLTTVHQRVQEKFNPACITMLDGTQIMVPVKPEDHFHIATPEILKNVTLDERKKLLWYQAYIDWKLCLQRDEDDNLPIHLAVMNNDTDVLRRQCLVLKNRNESIDITAGNLTALQMSIYQDTPECTVILLQHGADPLLADEEHRTALHLAAEGAEAHLRALLTHIAKNARRVLQNHEESWKPNMEDWSDANLSKYLIDFMCKMADNQGYTPLMLASKMGNYANVKLLAEASPESINTQMPNSGNTAVYLAIGAACLDAADRGNKSKIPEHFNRTISTLVEHGADPNIKNHSNSDVTDLLTEFNIAELSMLVANKMHTNKFGELPRSFDSYMILKDKDGVKNITSIKSNSVPNTNRQINSDKPLQSVKVSDKPSSFSEKTLKIQITANKNIDNTKKPNEKKSLTNAMVIFPGKSNTGTDTAKEDVLKKLMLDSDILELPGDLRRKKILDKMSERIAEKSERVESKDNLKPTKRKSPLVKAGPSSKKEKPVTEKSDTARVNLRSVRKAVKEHT